MNRVLLIDDDAGLCGMLVRYLALDGLTAEAVHDGARQHRHWRTTGASSQCCPVGSNGSSRCRHISLAQRVRQPMPPRL